MHCGACVMSERPFREPAQGPTDDGALERALVTARARGRAGSTASVVPLFGLAVAFGLPTARGCQHLVSGADMLAENPFGTVLVLLAPYVGALALAVVTAHFVATREPRPRALLRAVRAMYVYGAGAFIGSAALCVINVRERAPTLVGVGLGLVAAVLVGLVRVAWLSRANGWFDWCTLLNAYALLTVGWTPSWVVYGALRAGESQSGPGAHLYAASWALVLVASLWGSWPVRAVGATEVAGPT